MNDGDESTTPTNTTIKLTEQQEREKNEMGVSAAEWARRMIRLGRRQYGYPYEPEEIPDIPSIKTREDSKNENDLIKQFLLNNLSTEKFVSLDELVALLEEEIEETAKDLERRKIVESSFSEGGFRLQDDWEEQANSNDE